MSFRSPEQITNPSLLIRLRDVQDQQAWALFIEVYGPLIFSYCRRRNLQASDASDVSQEVFAVLSKSLPKFQYSADRGRFRDWLGLITHRELIRFWKRSERTRRGESSHGTSEVDFVEDQASWDEHFQAEVLQNAMSRIQGEFEPETWEIFEGICIKEESADSVAKAFGMNIGTVYVAKSRVLKRLRSEVLMLCEDWPLAQ